MSDRYERQQLIPDWIQQSLTRARVFVIGSGHLAQCIAAGLAGLGVGIVRAVDHGKISRVEEPELLRLVAQSGQPRAAASAKLVKEINPCTNVDFYSLPVLYEECLSCYPAPNVIVEATNDAVSKCACLRFAARRWTPVIFASAGPTDGKLAVYTPSQENAWSEEQYCMPEYDQQPQSPVTSLVMAGLALDEVRKLIMPLSEEDRPSDRVLVYNRASANRFDGQRDFPVAADAEYGGHVVQVGAGAIGNFLGLALSLSGVRRLTVIDFDTVQSTNLNRQVLFYDALDEYKATALVEKLRKINPEVEYEAVVGEVSEDFFRQHPADMICSAVDNFEARLLLHRVSLEQQIPLINGGTGAFGGRVALFQPGVTACLGCQLNLETWAQREKEQHIPRQGCAYVPEPSVVISNVIIAGMMAAEVGSILNPEAYGLPAKGLIEYSGFEAARVGLRSARGPCSCYAAAGAPVSP